MSDRELPVGIRGYLAGQRYNAQQDMHGLGMLQGVLALQNAAIDQQLHPLRVQQLQGQIAQAEQDRALMGAWLQARQGGGAPQGVLAGAPGMAASQAAMNVEGMGPTVTAAQAATQAGPAPAPGGVVPGGRLPQDVALGLVIPRLAPWAKEEAKMYAPTDKQRDLLARGIQPGSPQWNAELGTNFTQSGAWSIGADGNVTMAPGYVAGQGAVKGAEAAATAPYQIKERTIGGRTYTMSDADYATLYGSDQLKAIQVAERFGIPYNGGPTPGASPQPSPQPAPAPRVVPTATPAPLPAGAPIPAGRVIGPPVNPTSAERAAGETAAKNDADLVNTYKQKIPSLNATLNRLDRLEALNSDDRTYAAAGAEFKTQLGSIAQSVGIDVGKIKTANSELYLAQIGELMKDRLASKDYGSGSGVSNLDLLAAQQPLPQLAKTQQGRQLIINALRADTTSSLQDMNAARSHFERSLSLSGFQYPSEVTRQIQQTRPGQQPAPAPGPRGRGVVKWSDLGS